MTALDGRAPLNSSSHDGRSSNDRLICRCDHLMGRARFANTLIKTDEERHSAVLGGRASDRLVVLIRLVWLLGFSFVLFGSCFGFGLVVLG